MILFINARNTSLDRILVEGVPHGRTKAVICSAKTRKPKIFTGFVTRS